ncbi:MAG: AraC family transcriptional regulator [Lachnospiraceae bacterium]|nr:AraC family transcriptional regulator [Lachnospiraceae bacterium]
MNNDEILHDLRKFTEDELIYLDAFKMRKGELTEAHLKKKYAHNPYILGIALHPEDFLKDIAEDYIAEGRHTMISKHPRYATLLFHTHSFFEMTYVLEGSCIQHFEDDSFELVSGDFCILSPDTSHYLYDFSDCIVLNILVRQSTFMDIFSDYMRDNSDIARFFSDNLYAKKKLSFMLFHAGDDADIRDIVLKMYGEELTNDAYSDSIILNLIKICFSKLLRTHRKDMEIPKLTKAGNPVSEKMIGYIYSHYDTVNLEELSDKFSFSKQYCSKLITDLTGMSLSELRTKIRMRHASDLLKNTAMSVEEISEKMGYENTETFIRAFKRNMDITPGAFRKLQ